ncbi:MAG: lasso RiPP family leader peptide-containing protein [Anaerolineales bacterium]|nr:lasso RiPP family leader peptide-containing protein [Anaerolineales bacterium]
MFEMQEEYSEHKKRPEIGEKKKLKQYRKPRLVILGDLRTLTLGGSPTDVGDFSGSWNTRPFP